MTGLHRVTVSRRLSKMRAELLAFVSTPVGFGRVWDVPAQRLHLATPVEFMMTDAAKFSFDGKSLSLPARRPSHTAVAEGLRRNFGLVLQQFTLRRLLTAEPTLSL